MTTAQVRLWGKLIGAVSWDKDRGVANFEYTPEFNKSGIEVAPLCMPLTQQIYSFPALPKQTFYGLPGLLCDSLPDDFGNALINVWLANEGRSLESFNPVERLCYIGRRGMGALEYEPSESLSMGSEQININHLVELASDILTNRNKIKGSFLPESRRNTLHHILSIGTSAGGARAKAIIAWNPQTNDVRSGQHTYDNDFSYWLLKFDGVSGNRDKELDDPQGYGLIEYAYYMMAISAGINMNESRLLEENGRSHFMTKRFDRTENGHKVHMQSFAAIAHLDYKQAGAYSYEQVLRTIRQLGLPMEMIEEQFRRMCFNIIARNQDDHVKNIAFLMDKTGKWSLSPAFDMTYNYNPNGIWTGQHQMSLNGKCDNFSLDDFKACEKQAAMKRGRAEEILNQVQEAVSNWKRFAKQSGVPSKVGHAISQQHRRIKTH